MTNIEEFSDNTKYLGKHVRVYLDMGAESRTIVVGKLLEFGDDGEIVTQDNMGFVHWSWPMLKIEEI